MMRRDVVEALLLDFGGVVLRTPFELAPGFLDARGYPPGTLSWRGPFDLARDPMFAQVLEGSLAEREYWRIRSEEVAALVDAGYPHPPLHAMFEREEADLIRPEWVELIAEEQAGGMQVAILTNDLSHFHPRSWIDGITMLRRVDHVIDLSHTDYRKPDPRAFEGAASTLGPPADAILFVDDQPVNLAGASEVGMPHVLFDPTNVAVSIAEVRALL
jgi:putative hydrolase of the HAD superfamily